MKSDLYMLVFGIIVLLVLVALATTAIFNRITAPKNTTAPSGANVTAPSQNLTDYGIAPPLKGIAYWINSQPLNLTQLKGKVVLLDFWTYSCINCIRTLPYLEAWQKEYGSKGLVIIGVHTPEFQFEHNYTNVLNAVKADNITYAVAMDNNYSTWYEYGNQAWPEHYLIDKNGHVREIQIGEGGYNTTQNDIVQLLQQAGYNATMVSMNVSSTVNFSGINTPEVYFGYLYASGRDYIGNSEGFQPNKTVSYMLSVPIRNSTAYLSGQWYNAPDGMVAVNSSKIFLKYRAKNVNIVASGNSTETIKLDGKNVTQIYLGSDDKLVNGVAVVGVNASRLYNVISGPTYGWHTLEIDASPGFKIYTFTFG
ncbi:MAG: redoxin family protein [Candidatus Micrarchaeota archaeon]|nr:redoxin family protein [Candidatus Micrarchaeota archaeon]